MKSNPSGYEDISPYALPKVNALNVSSDGGEERLTPKEIEVIERESFVKGFSAGEESGRNLEKKAVETSCQTLSQLMAELRDFKETLLHSAEADILKIAIAISRRVLREELSLNPEVVMGYIREAIKKIGHADTVVIRINPQQLERLSGERSKILELIEGAKWLRFEPDLKIAIGECIVETPDRMLDARVDSQVSIIERRLNRLGEEG